MSQLGDPLQPEPSTEDSFLDLLVETLEGLDESLRGQFLRQFFRTVAQIDITEEQSNEYWVRILRRRSDLADHLGRKISLKTAMVDVLSAANLLRVPVLIEYDELKKLQINAATDALTGLHNRRLFDEYFEKEMNRAKRYGQQLAIVLLDLHKLKEVNDRHGHLQGDQVLQIAAATLRRTLRNSDFAFRIGGDEFAVLLPQTDTEQAVTLCRRVRSQYENELAPLTLEIGVTLDFGVAVHPQDGDQKSALMGLADKRLYELKQSGRAPSRVISLESQPAREREPQPTQEPQPMRESAPPAAAPGPAPSPRSAAPAAPGPSVVSSHVPHTDHRKWERVSLAGTKAHAILTEGSQKTAKVIDLSYGGVALQFDKAEDLPNQFNAVLHVPILPPVRVVLRKVHTLRTEGGRTRVGCSFVA
ncbi:MAG TPA: GGDEF domain-containing protein [Candidatus Acidoferrales bacterium]|nr:GGDEF domain-containing protein [Candidatus Acidoferrales bacterium]